MQIEEKIYKWHDFLYICIGFIQLDDFILKKD